MFMSLAKAAAALGFFAVTVWGAGECPLAMDMVWSMAKGPLDDVGGDGDARVGGAGDAPFASVFES